MLILRQLLLELVPHEFQSAELASIVDLYQSIEGLAGIVPEVFDGTTTGTDELVVAAPEALDLQRVVLGAAGRALEVDLSELTPLLYLDDLLHTVDTIPHYVHEGLVVNVVALDAGLLFIDGDILAPYEHLLLQLCTDLPYLLGTYLQSRSDLLLDDVLLVEQHL